MLPLLPKIPDEKRENFDKPVNELARTTKITAATTVKILKTQ